MRFIKEFDAKNYAPDEKKNVRPSVRGIVIRDNRVGMIHSLKYDYYTFPGGGIEKGETQLQTLRREVAEEAGLKVIPSSVKEFGDVRCIEMGKTSVFYQDNYYYVCEAEDGRLTQNLDDYERDEGFTLEFIHPFDAIKVNQDPKHKNTRELLTKREILILNMLMDEGYITK